MNAVAIALETFGSQLKAWRKSRGWSQVRLGDKIGYSDSLVSGIELGDKTPTADFAERCDEVMALPGTFKALHHLVSREAWPAYFSPVLDAELRAVRIHDWSPLSVPGLLQTENYARAVIAAGNPRLTGAELDRKVTSRMARQKIFDRDRPPHVWSVIWEGALRQVTGGREVMAEQLDKLLSLAATPDVVIQVLPFTRSDNPGTDGPIKVMDFSDTPSLGYAECSGGGLLTETPNGVAELVTTLSLIRAVALAPQDSLDMIRRIRSDLD